MGRNFIASKSHTKRETRSREEREEEEKGGVHCIYVT